MGDANDDTPRRAQSTVGGIFQGFRLKWQIRSNPLSKFEKPLVYRLMIEADLRDKGERELLDELGACITGHNVDVTLDHPVCYVYLHANCVWGHIASNQDGQRADMVFILHRKDPHSLLVLENTVQGLHVDPQGRWQQEIGQQIGKLAAQWALANMPPEALNPSPHGKTLGYYPRQRPNENIS